MNAQAPFAERGQRALTGAATSDEVHELVREGTKALAVAAKAAAVSRERALDPLTTPQGAKREQGRAVELELERDRVARMVEALRTRAADLARAETQTARQAAYDAALAERDVLAADLKARWPKLSVEMVELLRRLVASDANLVSVNANLPAGVDRLASAEAIARGAPPSFYLNGQPMLRLAGATIPKFEAVGHYAGQAWHAQMAGISWRPM